MNIGPPNYRASYATAKTSHEIQVYLNVITNGAEQLDFWLMQPNSDAT